MTDKLYFDATAREKLQPNTFMQSTLLKKLSAFICFCAVLCGSGRHVSAQISVGTTGTGTNAFGSQPTVAQGWSTLTVGAAGGTYTTAAGLDAAIIGSANRSTITTPLGASGTLPPSANAIARWNSDAANGLYLQTRPTGNDYLLLMATLRNNTGLNLAQVNISYLWGQKHPIPVVEEIPGHRAYFSLSGAPGSWALIPSLSSFSTTDAALNLNALLSVGTWTNGGNLYIIWADDNGSAGTETNAMREGSYTIDNFAVTPVSTAPNIFIQPQSQSVVPGGTVTFSVGASGFPLSFYWRRNGTFIPGATNQNLTITNAQIANEGSYSVIVSNALGNVTSANATLAAYCSTPISVVNQPSDQQIATGGSFALSVVASGTAPFTYQWYRNNSPIPNATNSSYSKVNAQSPDSGLYAVLINNCVAPLFSTNAVISVAPPPTVLIPLTNFVWRYNQSGTDFGTAWRASIYPAENTWPTGRGLFALETATGIAPLINTPLALNPGGGQIPTYYFRTQFVLTNDPAIVSLLTSNFLDDGMVMYLNGTEIFRVNMPAGTVSYSTLATAAFDPEGTPVIREIPSSALVLGTNVIAVEVHQNNLTSSDIVFGQQVFLAFRPSTLLVITNQPQNVTVEESHAVLIPLGLQGEPAFYQWYRNGVAISNGTSNPLLLDVPALVDAGSYFVIATNNVNSVTSSVFTVSVFVDTNTPTLIEADGTASMTNVLVSFSERITPLTATNTSNYRITNTIGGALLAITRATLQNGSNVMLQTAARTAGQNYILVVNNARDISPQANVIAPNSSIPVRSLVNFLALEGPWKFYNPILGINEPNLGTAWKEFTYATTDWGDGNGVFYNGDSNEIPGPVGTPLSQTDTYTSYFRSGFNSQVSPGGLRLLLTHVVDDGGIAYLNGQELLRFNLPAGTVDYLTPASSTVGGVSRLGPFSVLAPSLRQGANVLAFELHQSEMISVDKFFGLQVDASVQSFATGPVVITGHPSDATAVEGSTATFTVVQAGATAFQWQSNNVNIAGATNPTYTTIPVTMAMNNATYRVGVSSAVSSLFFSSNAILHVVSDTNRPTLVAASVGTNAIFVSFSESVTPATANSTANYAVTNLTGQSFGVTGASLASGTNVQLSFSSLPAGAYFVVVNNVRDTSAAGNAIASNSVIRAGYSAPVVSIASTWRYDASGVDRGLSSIWAARNYNDSGWTGSGQGMFAAKRDVTPNGGGGAYPAVWPEPVRTSMLLSNIDNTANLNTYYFRTAFNSPAAGSGSLTFRTLLDDGAVIYLNGAEVFRLGIGTGFTPTYDTVANRTVGEAAYEGPFTVPVTNVLAGSNVIAVEVHQVNATSSDINWAGEFTVTVDSVLVVPVTVPVQIVTQPLHRTNDVGQAAYFSVTASGGQPLFYQWRRNGANLLNATNSSLLITNVQAVGAGVYSVFVSNAVNGVLSSNVNLVINGACDGTYLAPLLSAQRNGTNIVLSWTNPINTCNATVPFILRSTLILASPAPSIWTTNVVSSPYTVGPTNTARFFELIKQ